MLKSSELLKDDRTQIIWDDRERIGHQGFETTELQSDTSNMKHELKDGSARTRGMMNWLLLFNALVKISQVLPQRYAHTRKKGGPPEVEE